MERDADVEFSIHAGRVKRKEFRSGSDSMFVEGRRQSYLRVPNGQWLMLVDGGCYILNTLPAIAFLGPSLGMFWVCCLFLHNIIPGEKQTS